MKKSKNYAWLLVMLEMMARRQRWQFMTKLEEQVALHLFTIENFDYPLKSFKVLNRTALNLHKNDGYSKLSINNRVDMLINILVSPLRWNKRLVAAVENVRKVDVAAILTGYSTISEDYCSQVLGL